MVTIAVSEEVRTKLRMLKSLFFLKKGMVITMSEIILKYLPSNEDEFDNSEEK